MCWKQQNTEPLQRARIHVWQISSYLQQIPGVHAPALFSNTQFSSFVSVHALFSPLIADSQNTHTHTLLWIMRRRRRALCEAICCISHSLMLWINTPDNIRCNSHHLSHSFHAASRARERVLRANDDCLSAIQLKQLQQRRPFPLTPRYFFIRRWQLKWPRKFLSKFIGNNHTNHPLIKFGQVKTDGKIFNNGIFQNNSEGDLYTLLFVMIFLLQ